MESLDINALVKKPNYTHPKFKSTIQKDEKTQFSEVITQQLSESNKESHTVISEEETELQTSMEEKIAHILQLLLPMNAAFQNPSINLEFIDNQQIDNLKQMFSELLVKSLGDENIGSQQLFVLNNFKLEPLNITELTDVATSKNNTLSQNADNLTSQIVDKFMIDSDFREQLITKLDETIYITKNRKDEALKQTIINELSTMVNTSDNISSINKETNKEIEFENDLQPEVHNLPLKSDIKINKTLTEDMKIKNVEFNSYTKAVNKEDKLLKDLGVQDSLKGTKEDFAGKIANVVTRFEVIRTDRGAVAEAPVTINRSSFNADFIKAVKFMDANNIKELSVKVIPKDLGEIVIRLSMDNGVMKANITAANKETYNILNSQLPVISSQLTEQNMNIQSFNLSFNNGDNFLFNSQQGGHSGSRQQRRHGDNLNESDDDILIQSYDLDDNNINTLA